MSPELYFAVMLITNPQKARRILLAEELENWFMDLFDDEFEDILDGTFKDNQELYIDRIIDKYLEITGVSITATDEYSKSVIDRAVKMAGEIQDTTWRNLTVPYLRKSSGRFASSTNAVVKGIHIPSSGNPSSGNPYSSSGNTSQGVRQKNTQGNTQSNTPNANQTQGLLGGYGIGDFEGSNTVPFMNGSNSYLGFGNTYQGQTDNQDAIQNIIQGESQTIQGTTQSSNQTIQSEGDYRIEDFIRDGIAIGTALFATENIRRWLGQERANLIALNEANWRWNNEEFFDAKSSNKKKTWHTALDEKVRFTHMELEGVTVGIDENFIVGGYPALYPCASTLPIHESANCRCTVEYK